MAISGKRKRVATVVAGPVAKRTRHQIREARSCFHFLRLPPEIRLIIYGFCGLNMQDSLGGIIRDPVLATPSVLLLNRQIYYEARDFMTKYNSLIFVLPQHERDFSEFVCLPALTRLRHLKIIVRHPEHGRGEQFWPGYIAHSTNTVEQVYLWMTSFITLWTKQGHNLTSFRMEFENDRVFHHLKACHRGCQVRESIRTFLDKFKTIRGMNTVELTGNVLQYYSKEVKDACDAMTRPALPNLQMLPDNILRKIAQLVVPISNHIDQWKHFEDPLWSQISADTDCSDASDADNKHYRLGFSDPEIPGSPAACVEQHQMSLARPSTTSIPAPMFNIFRAALQRLQRPQFSSSSIWRISPRFNEICKDIVGEQCLVFNQPFMPMFLVAKSRRINGPSATVSVQTISPFMTDQYLQAVRNIAIEYSSDFERNWLWVPFVTCLVRLWSKKHRMHKLTLRVRFNEQPEQRAAEKARRAIVKIFEPLGTLRGVGILVLDGPFKSSEQRKLEKMMLLR